YNRAHVLGESLASVLAERDVDLEVVVVDDGSTDDTAAVLAGLGDRRVRPVVRPHAGIAAARNAGLAAARAPYVAFHDSDDVVLPGRLAVPLAFLGAHPEVDLVIQNGRMLPPEDDPDGAEAPWIRPRVARALASRAPVSRPATRAARSRRWPRRARSTQITWPTACARSGSRCVAGSDGADRLHAPAARGRGDGGGPPAHGGRARGARARGAYLRGARGRAAARRHAPAGAGGARRPARPPALLCGR